MSTHGWLDFGSGHDSIIFEHDLLSEITAADIAGKADTVKVGSSNANDWHDPLVTPSRKPQHDPILGMLADDGLGNGLASTATYLIEGIKNHKGCPQSEGQVHIEVETEAACHINIVGYDSEGGWSSGTQNSGVMAFRCPGFKQTNVFNKSNGLGGTPNGSGSIGGSIGNATCNQQFANHLRQNLFGVPNLVTRGKGAFTRLSLGWKGDLVFFAVNGVILSCCTDRDFNDLFNVDIFDYWTIGTVAGNVGKGIGPYHVRNVTLSNEAPYFLSMSKVPKVAILSDSMVEERPANFQHTGEMSIPFSIRKIFEKHGMQVNITVSTNGGATVSDDDNIYPGEAQTAIIGASGSLIDFTYTFLQTQAPVVVIQGGTNDANGGQLQNNFIPSYKRLIERIMGVGVNAASGNPWPATATKRLILSNVPSAIVGTTAITGVLVPGVVGPRTIARNADIAALPAWWDATYPNQAGAVTMLDTFNLMGGDTPTEPFLYQGLTLETNDNFHLAPNGCRLIGEALGAMIFNYAIQP